MSEDQRNEYTIRPAVADDAEAVSILWTEMSEDHRRYDAEVWCWSKNARQHWRDELVAWLDDPDMVVLVAQDAAGRLIGYSVAHVKTSSPIFEDSRLGKVWDLCVTTAHRGKGLGEALMEEVFKCLKENGADSAILHVATANPAAIGLYEKLGMRPVMQRMFKKL